MYNNHRDILDAVGAAPKVLQVLLQDRTEEEAKTKRGGDEQWNLVEICCHLRDAEERALERMRMMRDQDNPWVAGYDPNQWARERNYAAASLDDALAGFLRFRAEYLQVLEGLMPEQWERAGTHEEHGRITILNYAINMVGHDATHLAQIAEQLRDSPPARDPVR